MPSSATLEEAEAASGEPRLQKLVQRMGLSKREARALIRGGQVRVDGQVRTRYAEAVAPHQRVSVAGVTAGREDRALYLMHKPVKHLTALEGDGELPGLGCYLPPDAPRVFPVGRLDVNTTGALLLTNDGDLARRVLHPDWSLPKRYHVKVRGHIGPDHPALARMRLGMTFGRETYRPAEVTWLDYRTRATWIAIVLREGRHRQIRRMCRAAGFQIVKLHRAAIGPIQVEGLNPRCVRRLTPQEVAALDEAVGLGPSESQREEGSRE